MTTRGQTHTHRRNICPPGLPRGLPSITIESETPGPKAAVCANLHGDECVGIGVIHDLASTLPDQLLRGSVRLYPTLNPEGLRAGARRAPGDRKDLNRAFPGDARGSAVERTAHAVWTDIRSFGPELVLDLHADSSASIPYTILDRLVVPGPDKPRRLATLLAFAKATGLTVVHDYKEAPYRRFGLDRSLSGALLNHGRLSAITLELGPRRLVHPDAARAGVQAVLGALTELGLVGRSATAHSSRVAGGPWRRDSGPSVRCAGILRPLHAPGTVLRSGQDLATVHSVDGELLERLSAPTRALILSLAERTWISPGESVATLAVPDEG